VSKTTRKDWKLHAEHIIDTIARMQRLMERGDLRKDEDLYDSALRKLQTISEATQHLPENLKKVHPEIEWRSIASFRNILVHAYLGDHIDIETVIDVVGNDLPGLHRAVKSMLASETKAKRKD
jgi:uncharacterized protein with HEPN domain